MNPFETVAEIETHRPFLSKGEYVYRLLKEKIVNGYLERNKIYTVVEIAESLGVSRTPVGEAVKILASQNYVIQFPGVGFKVKELTIDDIRETLIISGALEEAILHKIVSDGTPPSASLQEAMRKTWAAFEDQAPELYTQASAEYHKALYAMSGLPRVTEVLSENILAHEIWYREGAIRYPELIKRMIADHEAILELIRRREDGCIAEVIAAHVENCERVLTKVIKE